MSFSPRYQLYILTSPFVVLVPCAIWKWRGRGMNMLGKLGRIVKCTWLRYEPQDDEEAFNDLLERSTQQQQHRGSVAHLRAQFEQEKGNQDGRIVKRNEREQLMPNDDVPSCSQKFMSGTSLFLGFFSGSSPSNQTITDHSRSNNPTKSNATSMKKPRITPSSMHSCSVCKKKIFPTDESTSCRENTYHAGCFKCTLCRSKLKNHPDEVHLDLGDSFVLQCRQCRVDNEQKYVPRQLCTVAGEKIVVGEAEQGDIDQVVDAIGDDLEEAMYAMIPRCATCGGDFLKYKGDISIVGSMKYHKECFLTGKPGANAASLTLDAVQAAKYLPGNIILKLSTASTNKVITTLFFVWKKKEETIRSMRMNSDVDQDNVSIRFQLDNEARANPNFPSNVNNPKKTTATLPRSNDKNMDLRLEIIGDVAPQPPKLLKPVTMSSGYQKTSLLHATLGFAKYNLDHSLELNIPYNLTRNELDLLEATLTVKIQTGEFNM